MTDAGPSCPVCGKPVLPTAATVFRTAQDVAHERCIRVPRQPRVPRQGRAGVPRVPATQPGAVTDVRAPRGEAVLVREDAITYLSALLTDAQVLIVFQRDVVSEALRLFFRSLGAVALPARTAEQAMDLVQILGVELVLCDVSLLTADEPGFAERIRERAGQRPLAVLGIGASTEPAVMASAHLDGFLPKPVGYGDLAQALRQVGRRRPDWLDRQRERLRRRGEWLRAESERYRRDAEVQRLDAQATVTKAEKLAATSAASTSPFRIRDVRRSRPRYRPGLLGA
jgi:DNA-binding NarL/FixJ family response regulator